MTPSFPSYLPYLALTAFFILSTNASPLPQSNSSPSTNPPSTDSDSTTFQLPPDLTIQIHLLPGGSTTSTSTSVSPSTLNATLALLHLTLLEPANPKSLPLSGPLNVTLDATTAGIAPTDSETEGGDAPPSGFADLGYSTAAGVVEGVRRWVNGQGEGGVEGEISWTVSRMVLGGKGKEEGLVVGRGFVGGVG